MGLRVRAFISVVPRSIMVCGGAFFLALTTLLTLIIYGNIKNVNFFCEKIAKNVKTGSILAHFSFFVKFFARKMRKMSNSREKLSKMFKTGVILAHFDFFCQTVSQKKSLMIQLS
ncbi:hypothetical protein C6495_12485 [Candidatus Poribacteria bacterium]|nr:MAG: hypothetical protein C6495_12485 [Candidatus Poribacteria bacterium]